MTQTYQCAEIVLFRLNDGVNAGQYEQAMAFLGPLLKANPDAGPRVVSHSPEGDWCDHVLWRTKEAALAFADTFMQHPDTAAMLALIDQSSLSMRHADIATMD